MSDRFWVGWAQGVLCGIGWALIAGGVHAIGFAFVAASCAVGLALAWGQR